MDEETIRSLHAEIGELAVATDFVTKAQAVGAGISNTLEADFYVEALKEDIHRFGAPGIMNTDQGSKFTSFAWTDRG